jgi:hypothetical protein
VRRFREVYRVRRSHPAAPSLKRVVARLATDPYRPHKTSNFEDADVLRVRPQFVS